MRARKRAESEVREQPRRTIWDVAQRSGVSISTVSRVLNGQNYVASETRDKVLSAAQELGYMAHRQIQEQTQANEFTQLVGLTSVTMAAGPFSDIIAGCTESLHAHNARPVICPIPRRHNCNVPLLERLMQGSTVGALILGSTENDEVLQEAIESGFPFVVIHPDRQVAQNIPVVAASHWNGARTATEHLIGLGHRRIGFIKHTFQQYIGRERYAGFQLAMLSAGLPILPELVFESQDESKQGGYEAGLHLLSLPEPPTAIVAFSDLMAAGILKAAQERGVRVPQDISVVGFDDMEIAQVVTPELTTIRQPFEEMGRVGSDMLFRLISKQPLEATRIELTAGLVIRASTAPPPAQKPWQHDSTNNVIQ